MSKYSNDFLASIVVFLVALPLCMGIAVASGAPVSAGLITGILGGLVVGALSGAPLQVSGPAAGLAVIVWELIQKHGFETVGAIILVGGVTQIIAGILRLGGWFRAVSPAVIRGMLAGIGVLIFVSQFHIMLDDAPKGSGIKNIVALPSAIFEGILPLDGSIHNWAALIGILTIASMVAWDKYKPKRLKSLPGPLIGVVAGSLTAAVLQMKINFVQVPDNFLATIEPLSWNALLDAVSRTEVLLAGTALALIASAETLLCASATDLMHNGPRTRYDRELVAQGVGNLLCGLLGGLPMTGVIVRSTANVEAGGKTRVSAILHGVWILVFVVALPFVLAFVPISTLAAVLVFVGYKLVNVAVVRDLRHYGKTQVAIYLATLVMIVATDLLTGVATGFGLAVLKVFYDHVHLSVQVESSGESGRKTIVLNGSATFLHIPRLAAAIESVPLDQEIELHIEKLVSIDHGCLELLKARQKAGGKITVCWDTLHAKGVSSQKSPKITVS